jgi:hypothetical protein
MASDADACVPQTVTDFIFDLYDSVTLSQLTEEQSRLYNSVFRDLSSKVSQARRIVSHRIASSLTNNHPFSSLTHPFHLPYSSTLRRPRGRVLNRLHQNAMAILSFLLSTVN